MVFPFQTSSAAIAPVEQSTLDNGSTLLVRRDAIATRVAISFLVRAGANVETAATTSWRQAFAFAVLRATRLENIEKPNEEKKEHIVCKMGAAGVMCSTFAAAITAIEHSETAREGWAKKIALWRVAVMYGFIFHTESFCAPLKNCPCPVPQRPLPETL